MTRDGLPNRHDSDTEEGIKKDSSSRNAKNEVEFENPEIPTVNEVAWNFILLPIVMFGGFGRVSITSERKRTFNLAS